MAKANAGRILIMPRGTYDANATYELLDLVMYNNASWLAKKTATGIEPADGEYWHKMADGVELVTNLTTEVEGKALDASMGKVLKELIDAVGADALREKLDALEADNVVQKDDIEALKLAVESLGNIDNATVRYVSDEADENYDWLMLLENDTWKRWKYAGLSRYWFYHDGVNHGDFIVATELNKGTENSATTTVTAGTGLVMKVVRNTLTGQIALHWRTDERHDLTDRRVLKFHFNLIHVGDQRYAGADVYITSALSDAPSLTQSIVTYGTASTNDGDIELDISNLSGEYYICFKITSNIQNSTTTLTISDMYME